MLKGETSSITMIHSLVFTILLTAVFQRHVKCCYSDSKQLHICLNIYLERDYPQVEAILKALWQYSTSYSRGHVLLEGPSLDDICGNIAELESCFSEVAEECITYTHTYRFDRMMRSLIAIDNLLCFSESKDNLKALLTCALCIRNLRQHSPECQDEIFDWDEIWKGMLRLEIGSEICKPLEEQTRCLVRSLTRNQCGPHAGSIYNQTMLTWLNAWCSSCSIRISSALVAVSLFMSYITYLSFS